MAYEKVFTKPYESWHNLPTRDTPVTASVLEGYDGVIEHIEDFLDGSTAVKPVAKTSSMTQAVGVDSNGALYTTPGSGGGGGTASTTTYDNTESGLESTNVQGAIDELAENSGGGTAETTTYDNTESGMTATNVQAAIDELAGSSGGSTAETTTYSNTASGLTATNVQAAIDEIVSEAGTPVTPTAKTSAMTQQVGVDANGLLWTAPGSGGGGGSGSGIWTTLLDVRNESSQTATSYTLSDSVLNYESILVKGYYTYKGKNIVYGGIINVDSDIVDSTTIIRQIGAVSALAFDFDSTGYIITKNDSSQNNYIFGVYGYNSGNDASGTEYDNTTSGMTATNVQDAIDELADGAVNPTTKTEAMTQAVGVDTDGLLWTAPGGGGGMPIGVEAQTILFNTEQAMTDSDSLVLNQAVSNFTKIRAVGYYLYNSVKMYESVDVNVADIDYGNANKQFVLNIVTGGGGTRFYFNEDGTRLLTNSGAHSGPVYWSQIIGINYVFNGDAGGLDYDNTTSGLTSTNVQDAIDELADGAGSPVTLFDTETQASQNVTMTLNETVKNYSEIRIKGYMRFQGKELVTYHDYLVEDFTFGDTTKCYWFLIDNGDLGYFTINSDGDAITWISVAGSVFITEIVGIKN